ncbi:MAG TPA: hypothetical protein VJM13_07650 [Sphingopyxis sp.]|nr:hypothetical protein [Sphingopyxis sp.]
MIWTLLFAAAAPAAPAATPEAATDRVVSLVKGDGEAQCLPDRSLCLELSGGDDETARNLLVSLPASGDAEKISVALPRGLDAQSLSLWPKLVPIERASESGTQLAPEYLVGVIAEERAMYSGGGGSGGRLHLLQLGMAPHAIGLREVFDVVWDSSLMIRACFSEQDMKDRLGACHDEYSFRGTLAAAPNDGGELPALTYRSFATAYPMTSRRTEDNSEQKLKKSDLAQWSDPECSYTRTLRYNPATSRYEMDRAAPDCSVYTTP